MSADSYSCRYNNTVGSEVSELSFCTSLMYLGYDLL